MVAENLSTGVILSTKPKVSFYKKQNSFESTFSRLKASAQGQHERALDLLQTEIGQTANEVRKELLTSALESLTRTGAGDSLRISQFLADELSLIPDSKIAEFFIHRYRYEIYPILKKLDNYPPYLQIEPSSICNYRCVFCYQTDSTFSSRSSGMMGRMNLETFKKTVDLAENHIQFLSLASRGEPTLCKELPEMLKYSAGKFLNLKLNTNASMLTEEISHAILRSDVRTVVFSADAAEEPEYSRLRVGGNLDKVLANIKRFEEIRRSTYPTAKILTRVSGVHVDESQNLDKMISLWGELVDQIAFVAYNPWENIYVANPNGITTPCTDLWRRLFVWWNGAVNPCDSDFKSTLKMGSVHDSTLTELWRNPRYEMLRKGHLSGARTVIEPCKRCALI